MSELFDAIKKLHKPDGWVHLATTGKDGEPHVTPMMMGIGEELLYFSITGQQKKRNLERDPRACVAISTAESMAHVMVWGTIELRHDDESQVLWENMITTAFGDAGLSQRSRRISLEGTSLGVMTPTRHRIYGME